MIKKVILILVGVLTSSKTFALCATCKAVAEHNDGEFGNGLNSGILLLMLPPYILLMIIVLVAFKGKIRKGFKNFINS